MIDQIGGAMVSRASLFIFGAPGNGKSTITERMALLMGAPIEIPHAVAIGDEIIRVIDPVYHKIAEGEQPIDRRLVKVERPVVVAGGELKLQQLDLTYDTANRYYEAPLQWKANAGVFVIDDFGRQEVPPMRLLNRFIVPMEKKVDYLDLSASGRKIELPFLCQVVFSTNLSPTELVDEAFLRRMAYKIGVGNPTPEAFGRILRYECDRQGVSFDEKAIGYLLHNLYGKKPLRGSHPRVADRAAGRPGQLPPGVAAAHAANAEGGVRRLLQPGPRLRHRRRLGPTRKSPRPALVTPSSRRRRALQVAELSSLLRRQQLRDGEHDRVGRLLVGDPSCRPASSLATTNGLPKRDRDPRPRAASPRPWAGTRASRSGRPARPGTPPSAR